MFSGPQYWRLCSSSLVAANATAADPAPPTNTASIYAGGEWGNTESQRLDAGAVFRYHTATIFSASVSRGEADLAGRSGGLHLCDGKGHA